MFGIVSLSLLLLTTLSKKYTHMLCSSPFIYRTSCTHFGVISHHSSALAADRYVYLASAFVFAPCIMSVLTQAACSPLCCSRSKWSKFILYILCNGAPFNSITRFSSRLVLICASVDAWDRDQPQRCHAILKSRKCVRFLLFETKYIRTTNDSTGTARRCVTPKRIKSVSVVHWNVLPVAVANFWTGLCAVSSGSIRGRREILSQRSKSSFVTCF